MNIQNSSNADFGKGFRWTKEFKMFLFISQEIQYIETLFEILKYLNSLEQLCFSNVLVSNDVIKFNTNIKDDNGQFERIRYRKI